MKLDFTEVLTEVEPGFAENPFAVRDSEGTWYDGLISIAFLNQHFGHLQNATEMQAATDSEGLKLYFGWLADQGVLPR